MGSLEKGKRYVFKESTGTFVEGKASPKALPQELARLPGDLVTTEVAVADKVHELDPPHIREVLTDDYNEKVAADAAGAKRTLAGIADDPAFRQLAERYREPEPTAPLDARRITQERIDWQRFTTLRSKLVQANTLVSTGEAAAEAAIKWVFGLQHLWYATDDILDCEVKEGRSIGSWMRPRRLRYVDLEVDIQNPPRSILDLLATLGVPFPSVREIRKSLQWAETSFDISKDSDS